MIPYLQNAKQAFFARTPTRVRRTPGCSCRNTSTRVTKPAGGCPRTINPPILPMTHPHRSASSSSRRNLTHIRHTFHRGRLVDARSPPFRYGAARVRHSGERIEWPVHVFSFAIRCIGTHHRPPHRIQFGHRVFRQCRSYSIRCKLDAPPVPGVSTKGCNYFLLSSRSQLDYTQKRASQRDCLDRPSFNRDCNWS